MTATLRPATLSAQGVSASPSLIAKIRGDVVGERVLVPGPYGARPLVYADYVASGRALGFVERAVQERALPFYGNTHSETSLTGRETTALRDAARRAIAEAVGAGPEHAVIFAGSGATGAIDRLLRGLDLGAEVAAGRRPVVFVGPYEHHSNDLPWRESGALIERIDLDARGRISLGHLAERLAAHSGEMVKIGAFSAASNVTGIRSDLGPLARLLHRHGAVFVCDFAAAAPYVDMQLTLAENDPAARIDAIVFSPHKFIGGPGASGVLVADRRLFRRDRPGVVGGGTVSYVTADHHRYLHDVEHREEGGTPNIVGDIRAGAAVALKQAVGAAAIERRDAALMARLLDGLAGEPAVEVLGPRDAPRLGILSFNIRAGARQLHYGFVVALLNDLFGIQARGGCSCAGPYGHHLLDISAAQSAVFEAALADGWGILRPGWVRLGVNYFFDDATVDYLIGAILFVARHGLRFLPEYRVDAATGLWHHRDAPRRAAASMAEFLLPETRPVKAGVAEILPYLAEAETLAAARRLPLPRIRSQLAADIDGLRWFWMPGEVLDDAQPGAEA